MLHDAAHQQHRLKIEHELLEFVSFKGTARLDPLLSTGFGALVPVFIFCFDFFLSADLGA